MSKTPTIQFKRGDDFKLDMTLTDTNNTTAIAAALVLATATTTLKAAEDAVPQVPQDITDAQVALAAAQAAYDAAIIVDITGWTITSMLAWCGTQIATFTITILDPLAGTFTVSAGSVVTQTWVPRPYDIDIQFVRPKGKVSSETFTVEVLKDITNG